MVTGSLGLRVHGPRHNIGYSLPEGSKTSKYRIFHSPESLVLIAVCKHPVVKYHKKGLSGYPRLDSDSDALQTPLRPLLCSLNMQVNFYVFWACILIDKVLV